MQQPISVGWVLLKLFETVWRLFLILCILVALGGLALWMSERNPLKSQISVELSPAPSDCLAKGWPIHALIENKSSKTVGEVDLQFRVYPQGTSTDVASFGSRELHNILRPGDVLGWCFAMPELEEGSKGPYSVAADVTYAGELSKEVPVSATPPPPIEVARTPPPLVRMEAPPQGPVKHQRTGPKTIWQSVTDLIGAVMLFILVSSGGYALIGLIDRAFKTRLQAGLMDDRKDQAGCLVFPFAGFLNMLLVGSGGSYVLGALGWDAWLTQFDDWSWAHGLADGGLLLVGAIACQWPWLILLALPRRHARA